MDRCLDFRPEQGFLLVGNGTTDDGLPFPTVSKRYINVHPQPHSDLNDGAIGLAVPVLLRHLWIRLQPRYEHPVLSDRGSLSDNPQTSRDCNQYHECRGSTR